MRNLSIYIKDEALMRRAKALAGEEGFSALIAKALADFVQRSEDKARGETDHSVYVAGKVNQLIRFKGRKLISRLLAFAADEGVDVYETKGGKLVLVLRDPDTGEAYDYDTYNSLAELGGENELLRGLPPADLEAFIARVDEAMGQKWSKWID